MWILLILTWPDCLWPLHVTTCKDEGVAMHVSRCEGFSGQVRDPVTELVLTRCDKAAPLAVKRVAYGESGVVAFAVMGEVWGIYVILQE